MQAALVDVTQRTGIRACGPNCEGYYNALGRVATTFSPTVETAGRRRPHAGIGAPPRRDRAVRRHRLRAVQPRQGGRPGLQLRDLHRQRSRPEHGGLPGLHGGRSAHRRGDAVLRSGAQRPRFRQRAGQGAPARQAGHRHQDRPLRRRQPRQRVAHRVAVRRLRRVSRGVPALRRDRGGGRRRSRGDRRRGADLPAAERAPRRHHHAVRRRRRVDGRHPVGERPAGAAAVGGHPGAAARGDAVLWRVRQSGGCHRAGLQHRAGGDDGDGAARRVGRSGHAGADQLHGQHHARDAGCGAGEGHGGTLPASR